MILDYLTIDQVAWAMRRQPSTVREWCKKGLVPGAYKAFCQGSRKYAEWRIPKESLKLLMKQITAFRTKEKL